MIQISGCAPLLVLLAAAVSFSCRSTGEADAGSAWENLFTGDPAQLEAHFRGFRSEAVPAGWQARDGAIVLVGAGSGDLVTREDFASFDLVLEWRISPRGNSGVMFHVSEAPEYSATYWTGPEMQVLDNAVFDGKVDMVHAAGANYALHAPPADFTRAVGEWNEARILVDGKDVEYWLNGNRCCAYTIGSDDWRTRVAASKFGEWPGYGVQGTGKIVLQDHGNEVGYRNIRVRRL